MRDAPPSLVRYLFLKLRVLALYPSYKRYVAGIGSGHPLSGIRTSLRGDASADPTEFFDHYDAFAFWAAARIADRRARLKILDVGSIKMMNGILSASHDVTSMVLADCQDNLSNVTYVKHDVSNPLPFTDHSFDVFTSMVALPLIGLARYGDQLDPDCLVNLARELNRVMKPDGELIFSMCLGKNVLHFNNCWFLDMPTICSLFHGWKVTASLVDQMSSPYGSRVELSARFSENTSVADSRQGDYRVVFIHMRRDVKHDI